MSLLNKIAPWRFMWLAVFIFAAIGYSLFFFALFIPIPSDLKESLTDFMPSIGSLVTAAKIAKLKAEDPFAIQILILYCALGAILLSIWCLSNWLSNSQALALSTAHYFSVPVHKRPSKPRVLLASAMISGVAFFGWFVLFQMEKTTTGWRELIFFSQSVHSVTALIVFSSILALCIPTAIVFTHTAFSKNTQL